MWGNLLEEFLGGCVLILWVEFVFEEGELVYRLWGFDMGKNDI